MEQKKLTHEEKRKKYRKEYYLTHRKEIIENIKKYSLTHKEKIKKSKEQYYSTNKEKIKEYMRKYSVTHKEEKKEYMRKYSLTHKEKIKKSKRQYYLKNNKKIIKISQEESYNKIPSNNLDYSNIPCTSKQADERYKNQFNDESNSQFTFCNSTVNFNQNTIQNQYTELLTQTSSRNDIVNLLCAETNKDPKDDQKILTLSAQLLLINHRIKSIIENINPIRNIQETNPNDKSNTQNNNLKPDSSSFEYDTQNNTSLSIKKN